MTLFYFMKNHFVQYFFSIFGDPQTIIHDPLGGGVATLMLKTTVMAERFDRRELRIIP